MSARTLRRRPRAGGGGQNVDSLLDTMANVVGIMVVLMAVTQLTVGDAMKRIQAWESEEASELRDARQQAEAQLASLGSEDLTRSLELARMREQIRDLRAVAEPSTAADTATVTATAASQRLQVRRLEAKLADKQKQLANLKILLAEGTARAEQEGIALRLPDPRPAPLAAKQLLIFCRYGRVFDPRFDQLERELQEVLRTAPPPVPRYFEAYDVGNELLRWRVVDGLRGRSARLDWRRKDIGETAAELRSPDAKLRQVFAENDPQQSFLRFYVWEDSFEAYLEARRIAEEAGYAAGWVPIPDGQPLDFVKGRTPPTPVD